MSSGDRQRFNVLLRGDTGAGELQAELTEPPVSEARLDCDGDGVRRSPLTVELPGDEHLMSKEAARSGDGERLGKGKLDE